jgi:bifunctional non-homologous end joining protein LigD
MTKLAQYLDIDGRKIAVSNLDKVMYPAAHFTKGQVIDYYIRVAPYLLPHLKDRPVTLKRFPDGVQGKFFFEKDAPRFTPAWVRKFPVPRRNGGADIEYIVVDDLATLVWLGNLASLELHPFLHRVSNLDLPRSVVFDLDPGEGAGVLECARVAFLLRELLDELKLQAYAKVSGSKGLQVYVPLNRKAHYSSTQAFARAVAELLASRHPETIVSEMPKHLRASKVFIDWSQNSDFKTTVSVYSLRAKTDRPFVSLPVEWDELSKAVKAGDAQRLYWPPGDALDRIEKVGDLFGPVLTLKQELPRRSL